MIPQRTLEGTIELNTGSFAVQKRPPLFTGDSGALKVVVNVQQNGANCNLSGMSAEMYLYFVNTEIMTKAVEMSSNGCQLSGTLPQVALDGYPLLVIRLIDTSSGATIVAATTQVHLTKTNGEKVVTTQTPSPSEIVYVGRSPYIDDVTSRWMVWDDVTKSYVDSNVKAVGTGVAKVNKIAPAADGNVTIVDTNISSGAISGKQNINVALKYLKEIHDSLVTDLKAKTAETSDLHLGFYLDSNGDLCQMD